MIENEHSPRWAGLDWADASHTVCIIDADGTVIKRFTVENSPRGLARLTDELRDVAGVAIETCHGMVVAALMQAHLPVYPVNPKVAKRQRELEGAADNKSDAIDARALAQLLRTRHSSLRRLTQDDEQVQVLEALCRDEALLIGDRTALLEQLKDLLKGYYPQVLPYFTDWTNPAAWHFVRRFPTPQALLSARPDTIIKQLRTTKTELTQKRRQLIDSRREKPQWPGSPVIAQARSKRALAVVGMLISLQNSLASYRKQISEVFQQLPDAGLFTSLPGVGEKLAPRLLALLGTDRSRYDSAHPLQMLSGTAPVLEESGKRRVVRMRRACQKHFRTTMHLMAYCSTLYCPWAKAFYRMARARGDSHATALRKLGCKWLKIIYRMWQERMPYDEARYLNSLIRHNSPVIAAMRDAQSGG